MAMSKPWIEGEPHPTTPELSKGKFPGEWVNHQLPQPLTPADCKLAFDIIFSAATPIEDAIGWFCRVYGVDPSSLTITK